MKVKTFRIQFAKDKEVYEAGDLLSGDILLDITRGTLLKGFHIKFCGEACVKWREYVNKHYRKVVHEAYKTLFRHEITCYVGNEAYYRHDAMVEITACYMVYIGCLGSVTSLSISVKDTFLKPMVKGSGLTLLSPGQYRYPFQFKLPAKNLPASYEGKYGYVRYYIEARIDRTWKSEHFIIQGFSIQGSPVNLNKKADIRTPILVGKEVEVAQGCISLSHIQVKVETNRSGYVPGETLQFTAYVNNKSRHRIKKFRAVFVQFTSYYGHRRDSSKKICLREQTSELIVIKGKGFKAEVTKQIEGEFEIPPLPATGSHTFPYINIEYYLQFTVKVANFDKTVIDVIVPVLIGNIPSSQVYTWKEPQSNLVSLYQPLLTFDSGDATEASPMGVPQPIEKECIPPIRVRKPDDDDDIKEVIVDLKGRYKPKYRCYIEKCDVKPKMKVFQVGEDSVRFFFMKYMPYKVAKVAVHNAIEKSK